MKKSILAAMCLSMGLMAMPFMATAKQSYDFSDMSQPFLKLPFDVVSVDTTGEMPKTLHNYHLSTPFKKVIDTLNKMYDKKEKIDGYVIMGITAQNSGTYRVILARNNEHNYVSVSSEGAGTLFSVEAYPVSYVTGVYPISVYGFTLPDGSTSTVDLATEE